MGVEQHSCQLAPASRLLISSLALGSEAHRFDIINSQGIGIGRYHHVNISFGRTCCFSHKSRDIFFRELPLAHLRANDPSVSFYIWTRLSAPHGWGATGVALHISSAGRRSFKRSVGFHTAPHEAEFSQRPFGLALFNSENGSQLLFERKPFLLLQLLHWRKLLILTAKITIIKYDSCLRWCSLCILRSESPRPRPARLSPYSDAPTTGAPSCPCSVIAGTIWISFCSCSCEIHSRRVAFAAIFLAENCQAGCH